MLITEKTHEVGDVEKEYNKSENWGVEKTIINQSTSNTYLLCAKSDEKTACECGMMMMDTCFGKVFFFTWSSQHENLC